MDGEDVGELSMRSHGNLLGDGFSWQSFTKSTVYTLPFEYGMKCNHIMVIKKKNFFW